jgi:hypothetical protein
MQKMNINILLNFTLRVMPNIIVSVSLSVFTSFDYNN